MAKKFLAKIVLANMRENAVKTFCQFSIVFQAKTTEGEIDFHDWLGDSWGVLFSHPAPFTPICTTEMGSLADHATVNNLFL